MSKGKTGFELEMKGCVCMDRNCIAMMIAQDLMDHDVLDEDNFSFDTDELLEFTSKLILDRLKDYMIVSGTIL